MMKAKITGFVFGFALAASVLVLAQSISPVGAGGEGLFNGTQLRLAVDAGVPNKVQLVFGSAATSAFPGFKRVLTGLQIRLADDSAYGTLETRHNAVSQGADGPIAIAPQVIYISKGGSAAASTLADPTAAQEGTTIIFTASTAFAHTISNAAGSGFNGGGAASDVATFGGAIGDSMMITAIGLKWNVLFLRNVTLG